MTSPAGAALGSVGSVSDSSGRELTSYTHLYLYAIQSIQSFEIPACADQGLDFKSGLGLAY